MLGAACRRSDRPGYRGRPGGRGAKGAIPLRPVPAVEERGLCFQASGGRKRGAEAQIGAAGGRLQA